MKNTKFKKFMACAMSCALACTALAFPVSAASEYGTVSGNADKKASGEASGDGKVEDFISKEVFHVVLPTQDEAVTNSPFGFILDPQHLLYETSGNAYVSADAFDAEKYFVSGDTVFFKNVSGDGTTVGYTSTSDALKVTNKSSIDVDVTLTATPSKLGSGDAAINLVSGDVSGEAKNLLLKLAVSGDAVSGDGTATTTSTATPILAEGTTVKTTLPKASGNSYEVTYVSGESPSYQYVLKKNVSSDAFSNLDFWLTGECNDDADWSKATSTAPEIDIAWTLEKHVSTEAPSFSAGSALGTISYTPGVGPDALKSIDSVLFTYSDNSTYDGYHAFNRAWGAATTTSNTITLDASGISTGGFPGSQSVIINYTKQDNTTASATITITMSR